MLITNANLKVCIFSIHFRAAPGCYQVQKRILVGFFNRSFWFKLVDPPIRQLLGDICMHLLQMVQEAGSVYDPIITFFIE